MKDLQTIRADSMANALAELKRRLGPGAVVLHTRTARHGGILGIGGRPVVEVTAARCPDDLPAALRSSLSRHVGDGPETAARRRPCSAAVTSAVPAGGDGDRDGAVPRQFLQAPDEVKALVRDLARRDCSAGAPAVPESLLDVYTNLVRNEVAREVADELVGRLCREFAPEERRDGRLVRRRLAEFVESMLPLAGGIELAGGGRPTVIAVIGPAGAGKTTTVAKLAANFSLRQGRAVGLVTIDTRRIGAVDQLRTYAEIIDVPMKVVTELEELRPAIDAMSDRDVIFIDTAGQSPNDQIGVQDLRCHLNEARPDEVHLVLSAESGRRVLEDSIERFACLGVNRVIFTKLDEAIGCGVVLSCLHRAEARLSYVTTGQRVPCDIEVGDARRLAEVIVDQGRYVACRRDSQAADGLS